MFLFGREYFIIETVNPQINPPGGLFIFWTFVWRLIRGGGGLKIFHGNIPAEIFLLLNYFFDATRTRNIRTELSL